MRREKPAATQRLKYLAENPRCRDARKARHRARLTGERYEVFRQI
jgi:hypothetical protein